MGDAGESRTDALSNAENGSRSEVARTSRFAFRSHESGALDKLIRMAHDDTSSQCADQAFLARAKSGQESNGHDYRSDRQRSRHGCEKKSCLALSNCRKMRAFRN